MFNSSVKESYDNLKLEDVLGQQDWDRSFEIEWIESMIRQELPHLGDEDVEILALQRYEDGYYSEYDF